MNNYTLKVKQRIEQTIKYLKFNNIIKVDYKQSYTIKYSKLNKQQLTITHSKLKNNYTLNFITHSKLNKQIHTESWTNKQLTNNYSKLNKQLHTQSWTNYYTLKVEQTITHSINKQLDTQSWTNN